MRMLIDVDPINTYCDEQAELLAEREPEVFPAVPNRYRAGLPVTVTHGVMETKPAWEKAAPARKAKPYRRVEGNDPDGDDTPFLPDELSRGSVMRFDRTPLTRLLGRPFQEVGDCDFFDDVAEPFQAKPERARRMTDHELVSQFRPAKVKRSRCIKCRKCRGELTLNERDRGHGDGICDGCWFVRTVLKPGAKKGGMNCKSEGQTNLEALRALLNR